jgi:hypothetical protein
MSPGVSVRDLHIAHFFMSNQGASPASAIEKTRAIAADSRTILLDIEIYLLER